MKPVKFIVPFLTLLLSGCFNVREPEAPSTQSEWTAASQPSILLDNFTRAVQQLNPATYERCLAPDVFTFLPDPDAATNSNQIFDNWAYTEEQAYFNSLKKRSAAGGANQLHLSPTSRPDNFTGDSLVELSRHYKLTVFHQDTAFKTVNFEGTLRFIMRRYNNEWKIALWQDSKTGPEPCWSELKKYFFTH